MNYPIKKILNLKKFFKGNIISKTGIKANEQMGEVIKKACATKLERKSNNSNDHHVRRGFGLFDLYLISVKDEAKKKAAMTLGLFTWLII